MALASLIFQFNLPVRVGVPSDSVIPRISTLGPVVPRLFRDVCNAGNGLHILQAEFYRHQETKRCAMVHGQRLSVEMSREQGLRMTGCRQIERYEIWVGISRRVEIDRRLHPNPFGLRHWWISAQQIIES